MEGSSSGTFNSGAAPGSSFNGDEDIVVSFRSLGFAEDGTLTNQASTTNQSNNDTNGFGPSSSLLNLSAAPTQERDINVTGTQSTRRFDTLVMNHRLDANMAGYSSRNLFPDDNGMWGYQDFTHYGGNQAPSPSLPYGQEHFLGSNDHTRKFLDIREGFSRNRYGEMSLDYRYGCLGRSSSFNRFNIEQRLIDPTNEYCRGDNTWNRNQNLSRMTPNLYSYDHYSQFQETGIRGCCLPDRFHWNNYSESASSGLWNQSAENHNSLKLEILQLREDNLITMATTPHGSLCLQEILKLPYPEYTEMILIRVHHSLIELMTDDYGKHVFRKLIEACNANQLKLIMMIPEVKQASFVNAALSTNGAHSIQRLIKRVKRTPHASTITKILSTIFFELMTDRTGMFVIQKCLIHFGIEENEALYDEAIRYCIPLATNITGCISLNACIDSISGLRREKLLNLIADTSDYLSNDPSGNFVVQHVLSLRNEGITSRICKRLRGQYIQLALQMGGTHVVQKCIQLSELGMILAVEEIVHHDKAAFKLAKDRYGNYVIQTALLETKSKNIRLYESLVMALKPYYANLMCDTIGKYVFNMIKDEKASSQRA